MVVFIESDKAEKIVEHYVLAPYLISVIWFSTKTVKTTSKRQIVRPPRPGTWRSRFLSQRGVNKFDTSDCAGIGRLIG